MPRTKGTDAGHPIGGPRASTGQESVRAGPGVVQVAPTTVLLADDHHLDREGLRHVLGDSGAVTVAAEAVDGESAIRLAWDLQPQVVLIALNMPRIDGIRATEAVTGSCPNTGVDALTPYWDDHVALQVGRAGARGYLLTSARAEDVPRAVRLAACDGPAMDPALAPMLLREYDRMRRHTPEGGGAGESTGRLSRRDVNLLRLLAEGSDRRIAAELGAAERTSKNSLSTLFQTIGVRDRTRAAIFAISTGLVPGQMDHAT